jgi:uncharacterized protein with GYD domain
MAKDQGLIVMLFDLYPFSTRSSVMATFILTGKYTPQALQEISSGRTKKALGLIKKYKGAVQVMYATLGQNDLVFIVDFPGLNDALKTSVALSKLTGIGFTSAPAVTVDVFDKLTGDL